MPSACWATLLGHSPRQQGARQQALRARFAAGITSCLQSYNRPVSHIPQDGAKLAVLQPAAASFAAAACAAALLAAPLPAMADLVQVCEQNGLKA